MTPNLVSFLTPERGKETKFGDGGVMPITNPYSATVFG